ncbi:serine hydrolase domain-containing protein [Lentzea sp. NPDC058450]|uniref:serine hydrolase domain-containing protein n=1 Tax=Lentzea sp. NPDC058450 TaxID=3346505 RepID=UPI0036461942
MSGNIPRRTFLVVTGAAAAAGAVTVLPISATGAPRDDLRQRLDAALARSTAKYGDLGAQAVAIRQGQPVWTAHRGKAIITPSRPVDDNSMFAYASLSKLLVAAFALSQVEKGVIALDTPISTYLSDTVAGSRVVTPRMLLTHTAGYPDVYADPAVEPLFPPGARYDPNRPYTFEMLNAGIRQPVNPGRRFDYSNTGYHVLGQVLVKTAGGVDAFHRAFRQFLQKAGTAQMPLTDAMITAERSPQAFSRFVHGYTREENGSLQDFFTAYGATGIPTDLYGLPFTDGLVAGTATGVGMVLDAVFACDRLLRPATVQQMVKASPQSGSDPIFKGYGMGTYPQTVAGRTWQGHGGSYVGFNSMAGTDRSRGITVAVVVNHLTDDRAAEVIWKELVKTV